MSTKERLDAGELVWVTNYSTPQNSDDLYIGSTYMQESQENMQLLAEIRNQYGEENVVTGNAFDPETGTASGIPKKVGVYVTAEAYKASQSTDS